MIYSAIKAMELKAVRVRNIVWMDGYTSRSEAYLVTLTDRCSFLCVSGQRGTIAKSMHEEHLSVCRSPDKYGARNPVLSVCLLPPCVIAYLLLFVYSYVNNGVVYLDYEDSTSPLSSVLVSMIVLDSSLLFDDVLFCLRCLSGVPAWRLM